MENIMYQVSTLQALILGYSRTVINVGELIQKGDTGLGTFEDVNGEDRGLTVTQTLFGRKQDVLNDHSAHAGTYNRDLPVQGKIQTHRRLSAGDPR